MVVPKYHRLQGDMIELYKIITSKQDTDVTLKFNTFQLQLPEATHTKQDKTM